MTRTLHNKSPRQAFYWLWLPHICLTSALLYLHHQQVLATTLSPVISPQQQPLNPNNLDSGALHQALSQIVLQQQQQTLGAAGATPNGFAITPGQIFNNNNINSNQTSIGPVTAASGTEANGNQFVIRWLHNDPKNQFAYVSITKVNHTNLHEPRINLRYKSNYPYVVLDERVSNDTVVAAVIVNDEDTGPNGETDLSIEHGNELGHFKLVSTQLSNTIRVNGAPLSRQRISDYNLTIVARDRGTPPLSSTTNLIIKLQPSTMAQSLMNKDTLDFPGNLKQPVGDLMYVGTALVVIFSFLIFLIILGCALVQRPKTKPHKGPPPRATSGAPPTRLHPSDQCSAYCLGLTNL